MEHPYIQRNIEAFLKAKRTPEICIE